MMLLNILLKKLKMIRKTKTYEIKCVYPYDYMDSFNRLSEKNYQIKAIFTAY